MVKVWNSMVYKDDDIELLTRMFNEFYSYTDIGMALHRSKASIQQKVAGLGLKRDHTMVRIVQRYGLEAIAIGKDRAALKALDKAQQQEKLQQTRNMREHEKRVILAKLKVDIAAGADYNRCLKAAYGGGNVSIKAIAEALGVTHWHVQTRVLPVRKDRGLPDWP